MFASKHITVHSAEKTRNAPSRQSWAHQRVAGSAHTHTTPRQQIAYSGILCDICGECWDFSLDKINSHLSGTVSSAHGRRPGRCKNTWGGTRSPEMEAMGKAFWDLETGRSRPIRKELSSLPLAIDDYGNCWQTKREKLLKRWHIAAQRLIRADSCRDEKCW